MLLKKIQILWIMALLTLIANGQGVKKNYPDADAVYLNLTKTYVLNKDGSMLLSVDKRQKLLTHRAFQSLYGETRISYNPHFQKVVINSAFTENSQHEIIMTPANGFNEVLPGFSNNILAFSHLREMVVTHTGLEQGAVINCNYSLETESGILPWLMGNEEIQNECPIEKLSIIVKVPSGMVLHSILLNTSCKPKIEKGKELDVYTWQFNDLPQRNRELLSSNCQELPRLLFTTQTDNLSVIKWLSDRDHFGSTAGTEIKKYVDQKIAGSTTPMLKIMNIQEIVVKELNTTSIPAMLLAFQVRTPDQVWQSNAGTLMEKCLLLSAILNAEGVPSEVVLVVPECLRAENSPFLIAAEPVVKISTEKEGTIFLSADKLNGNSFELFNNHQFIISESDNKNLNSGGNTGKIEVNGRVTLDKDGRFKGDLTGNFANRCNPYFDLERNSGQTTKLLTGLTGRAEQSSQALSLLKFNEDKENGAIARGNIRFLDIIESENGIASYHLNPLPSKRSTTLDLGFPLSESYHYFYTVPEGYKLANPVRIELKKQDIGKLSIMIEQQGQTIEIKRELELSKSSFSREEYLSFRELLAVWFTAKYRQLMLKTEQPN